MLPDILNYIPDPQKGRPIANGRVYFLIAGYNPPMQASDVDVTKIAEVTGNGLVIPQPIYTTKGGTLRVGSPTNQPLLNVDSSVARVAVYDLCGRLVYSTAFNGFGVFVEVDSLAATDSGVLVAAVKALDLARKYNEFVLVEDYSSLVIGGDWTAAWNAALATGKNVAGSKGANYTVSGQLHCVDNQYIDLRKSTITQTSVQTPIFNAVNHAGVTVTGGKLVGCVEPTYFNSPSSLAIGVLGTGATNLKVYDMEFSGFYYSPLMVASGGNGIWFFNNSVTGIPAVLALDTNYRNTSGATIIGEKIYVDNIDVSGTASGLFIGQGSRYVNLSNLRLHDMVNEHGIYVDTGVRDFTLTNSIIWNTGDFGTGLKVQFYDAWGTQPSNYAISNVLFRNTGESSLLIDNIGAGNMNLLGLAISNVVSINSRSYAFNLRYIDDGTISNFVALSPEQSGLAFGKCTGLRISNGRIRESGTSGLRDLVAASSDVTIENVKIINSGRNNNVNDKAGVLLAFAHTDMVISNVVGRDNLSRSNYGLFVQQDMNAELTLVDNDFSGSSETGCRFAATTPMREYRNNKWSGGVVPAFNGPSLPSISSAANILIPQHYDIFKVSGTTNISGIEATGNANRKISMIFTDTLSVLNSGNIKMSAPFSAAPDKMLTLVCDGTNWYGQ